MLRQTVVVFGTGGRPVTPDETLTRNNFPSRGVTIFGYRCVPSYTLVTRGPALVTRVTAGRVLVCVQIITVFLGYDSNCRVIMNSTRCIIYQLSCSYELRNYGLQSLLSQWPPETGDTPIVLFDPYIDPFETCSLDIAVFISRQIIIIKSNNLPCAALHVGDPANL